MLEPNSYWCYIKVVHAWWSPNVSSFLDLNNKVAIFYGIFLIKNCKYKKELRINC
jgi:hypothetical protein